jgi:hypothetical protein
MSISTGEVRGSAADDDPEGSPFANSGPGRLRPVGYGNRRAWRGIPGLPNEGHYGRPTPPARANVARAALYGSTEPEHAAELGEPPLAGAESPPPVAADDHRPPEADYAGWPGWEALADHSRIHGGI